MYSLVLSLILAPLVRQLGEDDWQAREAAQDRLQRVLPVAGPWVVYTARNAPTNVVGDPEAIRRLRELADEYEAIPNPRCMFWMLGITPWHFTYFGEWSYTKGRDEGRGSERSRPKDVLPDEKHRYGWETWEECQDEVPWWGRAIFLRYLYPRKDTLEDALFDPHASRMATRHLARDLLKWLPKCVVVRLLSE